MATVRGPLPPLHLDVLYLLVIGDRRTTIAHELHLSPRTLDVRIADLKRALGAPDRFGLGVGAVRDGWIDSHYPTTHAAGRRVAADWVAPTPRQLDILRLRAGGAPAGAVATKLGVRTSTVHRYLSQLAVDNGARNAVSAGALFEALAWT